MPKEPVGRPSHHYIGVDNKTLQDTLIELKKVYAQNVGLFVRLHNLHIELSELTINLNKLVAAVITVLNEPMRIGDMEAVLRDFLFNKHKK